MLRRRATDINQGFVNGKALFVKFCNQAFSRLSVWQVKTNMEKLISEIFNIEVTTVNDELDFDSIPNWDSLTHMQLIIQLEETYKVQLSGDEIADMRSVGAARAALRAHGIAV